MSAICDGDKGKVFVELGGSTIPLLRGRDIECILALPFKFASPGPDPEPVAHVVLVSGVDENLDFLVEERGDEGFKGMKEIDRSKLLPNSGVYRDPRFLCV